MILIVYFSITCNLTLYMFSLPLQIPLPVGLRRNPPRSCVDRQQHRPDPSRGGRIRPESEVPGEGVGVEQQVPRQKQSQGGCQSSFGGQDAELHGRFQVHLSLF